MGAPEEEGADPQSCWDLLGLGRAEGSQHRRRHLLVYGGESLPPSSLHRAALVRVGVTLGPTGQGSAGAEAAESALGGYCHQVVARVVAGPSTWAPSLRESMSPRAFPAWPGAECALAL